MVSDFIFRLKVLICNNFHNNYVINFFLKSFIPKLQIPIMNDRSTKCIPGEYSNRKTRGCEFPCSSRVNFLNE